MKKILFASLLLALCFSANAQTTFKGTATNPDTSGMTFLRNNGIDTLDLTMSGSYNEVMTIQYYETKIDGTVAGTARLYGSNWKLTGSWDAVSDTLTTGNNATNSKTWTLNKPAYKYYRILRSGGTTMQIRAGAAALGIKPN